MKLSNKRRKELILEYFKIFSRELEDEPVTDSITRLDKIKKSLMASHDEILKEAEKVLEEQM